MQALAAEKTATEKRPLTVTARIDEKPPTRTEVKPVSTPVPPSTPQAAAPTPAPAAPASVQAPLQAVQAVAPVQSAPPQPGGWWQEAFSQVQNTLLAVQALQQQTAKTHQKFLEGQETAQRTFQMMVESQRRLMDTLLTGQTPSLTPVQFTPAPAPVAAPAPVQAAVTITPAAAVPAPRPAANTCSAMCGTCRITATPMATASRTDFRSDSARLPVPR